MQNYEKKTAQRLHVVSYTFVFVTNKKQEG